jgi:hypothetical protein
MIHYLLWQTTLHLLVNFSNGQKLIVWVFGHKNLFLILFFLLENTFKKHPNLTGREGLSVRSYIKYYQWNYFDGDSIDHSIYQCHITVWFAFLNPIVILSVTAFVKTYIPSHCLIFFIPSISTAIPSVYTNDIFPLVFTDRVSNEKISR